MVENCEMEGARVSESLGKGEGVTPGRNSAGLFPKPQATGLLGFICIVAATTLSLIYLCLYECIYTSVCCVHCFKKLRDVNGGFY